MACHLISAKPLSEPMIIYCQLEPSEKNLREILIEIQLTKFNILSWPQSVNPWHSDFFYPLVIASNLSVQYMIDDKIISTKCFLNVEHIEGIS